MNVINITTSFIKLFSGENKDMKETRLKACSLCPISNKSTWCRKENGGCGCYLPAKASEHSNECPEGVWYRNIVDLSKIPKR